MANRQIIGDFEYPDVQTWPVRLKYVGPTGLGSVAKVPASVEGLRIEDSRYTYALEGKDIETLILGRNIELRNMHSLKHIIYETEAVASLSQGHVTLGEMVKEIVRLEVADPLADTSASVHGLPKRIDFLSATPPTIRTVSPGSIAEAELHVPAGTLRTYAEHGQWRQAPVIIDADGRSIVNTSNLEARLRKFNEAREIAAEEKRRNDERMQQQAINVAKQEKIRAMGDMIHRTVGPQKLARWNPVVERDLYSTIEYKVQVDCFTLIITLEKSAPLAVWDTIVSQLEFVEKEISQK